MRILCIPAILFASAALSPAAEPIIDNDRVSVWDVTSKAAYRHDFVTIYLAPEKLKGHVSLSRAGESKLKAGERAIIIEIKDHAPTALPNKTGYPNAFPRPRSKKILENSRIVVWSYAFRPGEPSPMHFHDKDACVTYLEPTALRSTTPAGETVLNDYKAFEVRCNPNNRMHTEVLDHGTGSAVITELK